MPDIPGFSLLSPAAEPDGRKGGKILRVHCKVVIDVGFITPAVIQAVPVEPVFCEQT